MTVLQPADVESRRQKQNEAEQHTPGTARNAEPYYAVSDDKDDNRPGQRLAGRTAAATQAIAAEESRRQGGELHAEAGVGTGAAQPRRIHKSSDADERSRQDISAANGPAHRNTGIVRRPA